MAKRNGTGIALLADETRRRIVALLAVRPRRPSAIAAELGLSRPATSRQLRLLEQAGLIWAFRSRLDGRGVVYSINPSAHGRIIAWLAGTDVGLPDRGDVTEVVPPAWNNGDSVVVGPTDAPSPAQAEVVPRDRNDPKSAILGAVHRQPISGSDVG
jgi:DNA-binding transcriptional ArsR family regulator